MGRLTILLHANSELALKDEYFLDEEKYNQVIEERRELSAWFIVESEINEFTIFPKNDDYLYSYDFLDKLIIHLDLIQSPSTPEYRKKFDGYFDDACPYISEPSTLELSNFLSKYFKKGYGAYIFNVTLFGVEFSYTIRFRIEDDCINFVFEIMELDSSMETRRVELRYPRDN